MATVEVWIQLEANAWDVSPRWPVDRATAEGALPVAELSQVQLTSPITHKTRTVSVRRPLPQAALILRRYTADWRQPDDRKVNPWDLNEPDPTDDGTMGTIPGPVIECEVGDTVRVHFRNMDFRPVRFVPPWEAREVPLLPVELRTHSLHAHGLLYAREHDGAYPLTPPDRGQPVEAGEAPAWALVGVRSLKQGDRVPPGATFTYTWEARWPTSAGVWHYHDHSIAHESSMGLGAIGIIVVRNPDDQENEVEITPARLPDGSWTGSPVESRSSDLGDRLRIMPHDLGLLGLPTVEGAARLEEGIRDAVMDAGILPPPGLPGMALELDPDLGYVKALDYDTYRKPPDQARFLLLFHEMAGVGMCINGRQHLGNAPTLVAGPKTRMRFGIVGAGDAFHTFHIHGHRWVVPGPAGKTQAAIAKSPQVQAATPFEDAHVFGPASSFAFTLEEGEGMMRADPAIGEWHLHCHVGHHMMEGMVGSLLIVEGGELALPLPIGRGVPEGEPAPEPETHTINLIDGRRYGPIAGGDMKIHQGDTVIWVNTMKNAIELNGDQPTKWLTAPLKPGESVSYTFNSLGKFRWGHAASLGTAYAWIEVVPPSTYIAPGSGTGAATGPAPAAPPAGGTTHQVAITSTGFAPSTLSISAGDSLNWTNQDYSAHTATADDHSWTTPTLTSGKSFARPFPGAGTFAYHCHIHHEMTGTVVVA